MFKLDMNAIRKSANDKLLTANAANAANFANESGKTVAQISKKSPKLAGLAGLAVSRQLNCTVQGVPSSTQPPDLVQPPNPAPEPPTDPNAWRELAAAYHAHHFKCPVCIAAGRGAGYGLRCGTGAALWTSYSDATERPDKKGRP